jgi:hypothetical protein
MLEGYGNQIIFCYMNSSLCTCIEKQYIKMCDDLGNIYHFEENALCPDSPDCLCCS